MIGAREIYVRNNILLISSKWQKRQNLCTRKMERSATRFIERSQTKETVVCRQNSINAIKFTASATIRRKFALLHFNDVKSFQC